ncbi:aldo/keto reductase [Leptolyngbya sp. CCNP1308]|uniref:aldo/keto reductase n=1 Tax=Leptolyngbya sp. CCNP1308 TaxID=3110255 RepID=UPI002B1F48E7|nr:aldo/keto reductase [Leptolyngbya sp. CCNP1308]MEA5449350.1 aldo/keto reductase [Leptolyngbya sp. CCNP1308]
MKVSVFGIGTYQLSGPVSLDGKADGFPDVGYDAAINLIHACEDMGINVIDSAEIYGAGEGERRVGKAIQGRRDRWLLSTKFGWRRGQRGERITDAHSNTIRNSLEGSLRRLKTDYVDIYQYHTPPSLDDIDQGIDVLEMLKQEGKIRHYGISTDDSFILLNLLSRSNLEVVQFERSLLKEPRKILLLAQKFDLGTMIRGALKSGILSGKYFYEEPVLDKDDIRKDWFSNLDFSQFYAYESLVPETFSMVNLSLRYLLDSETTNLIVLGGKSTANYREAVRTLQMPILKTETQNKIANIRRRFYLKNAAKKISSKIQFTFR